MPKRQLSRKNKQFLYVAVKKLFPFLLLLFLFTLSQIWSLPATQGGYFTLHFFDVGQGDASLLQCGRTQALIDGGPDRTVLIRLGQSMPFTDRQIEYVFLTHPHDDHLFGLFSVLERYEVGTLIVSEYVEDLELGRELISLAKELGVSIFKVRSGDLFTINDCGQIKVLWPIIRADELVRDNHDSINDQSMVLQLDSLNQQPLALFMGDAGVDVEQILIDQEQLKPTQILKVGHHGSRYSTDYDFLQIVDPEVAVISVGENSYGHPAKIILDRLNVLGIVTWRTDRDSTVIFNLSIEEN